MSAEPPEPAVSGEPAGQLAADGWAGAPASVFALPAKTSYRFALLVAAVVISSGMVYEAIYLATPRGAAVVTVIRVCLARALAPHPHGLSAYAGALGQARACRAGAERVEGLWVLLGIGLLGFLAGALYGVQPWWYRRRMRLTPLTSQEAPLVVERLEQLRQLAGTSPVIWLLRPADLRLTAFAFGTVRRRFVAVSGGAIVTQVRQPAVFDAVVLHELSHIRNRDIDQAYLAVAIWRAFVVVALLPMAGLLISRQLGSQPELLWRVVALALLVYLLRNSILRAREFDADARVAELDPDTGLGTVLAALPQRRGRRAWHLGWLHPSGQARAAALLDPAPLYECGFWDGLAVGLVAAMGAEAGQGLAYLLLTASSAGGLVPAFIFALFSAAALAVAVWRMRYWTGGTATARIWAVGLGLGIGIAVGPVITLQTALDHVVAPDSLHTGSFIVLALWVVLVTLLFASVPAWIGRWADAWQRRERRVPARGGMIAAAVGTWIVLAIGLDLVLGYFTFVEEFSPATKTVLAQTWTFSGHDAARLTGAWLVCLVFVAIPLSGLIARVRQQPVSSVRRAGAAARLWLKRTRPAVLICLAGVAAAVAVTLATAAMAKARIAPGIRWNGLYYGNFLQFEEQMVILVAVLIALIAAATLSYALSDTIAIVVGAAVAALGILVMTGSDTVGNCVAPFNLVYDHPPASDCPGYPGWLAADIFPAAIEAALIGILLIPAAHDAGIALARRAGQRRHPGPAARALRLLGTGAAAAAVIAGISLRVPDASAHGIQPIGSIGQDGWVQGTGYQIRLFPNWYDRTPPANRDNILILYDGRYSGVSAYLSLLTVRAGPGTKITGKGGHAFLLDGAPGMTFTDPDEHGYFVQKWLVIRGSLGYIVTFRTMTADRATREPSISAMINSWKWDATNS